MENGRRDELFGARLTFYSLVSSMYAVADDPRSSTPELLKMMHSGLQLAYDDIGKLDPTANAHVLCMRELEKDLELEEQK